MSIVAALKDLLRGPYKRLFPGTWAIRSWSQEGEDILIGGLLGDVDRGFYVDIGCHHPYRFSNTYRLYRRGWSGLCIDPLPGVKQAFARARPRDRVLEAAVSQAPGRLEYFMFNEAALNTFDPVLAQAQSARPGYRIERTVVRETRPLRELLAEEAVGAIDFMTIDVEGLDLEVLRSNDWQRWRPRVLIVECLAARLDALPADPIHAFLTAQGYTAVQKAGRNLIFIDGAAQ
jgi:FkbM family methyltransferase